MTMLLVLSGALKIIFIFMNYSLHFRIEGKTSGHFELLLKAGVMSLIILVINCLMRLVVIDALLRYKLSLSQRNTTAIPNSRHLFAYTTPSSTLLMRAVWYIWFTKAQNKIQLSFSLQISILL